jgi:hypothetical protein
MPNTTFISFHFSEKMAVKVNSNGTIEYGEDYTPDEAAKAFWEVVKQYHPYAQEIAALRDALAKYGIKVVITVPEDPIVAYDRAMKIIGRP